MAKSVLSTFGPRADHSTTLTRRIARAISPIVPSLRVVPRRGPGLALCIGSYPCRIVIGLSKPNLAVPEVARQFRVLGAHIASPDHLRTVDVGTVVHPFIKN